MPTNLECICYCEIDPIVNKFQESEIDINCITEHEGFNSVCILLCLGSANSISQRGNSPFVYRDGTGWPASLPYIRKIRVSVAIVSQFGIRLHERVPIVKIWGSSKYAQNLTTGKLLKFEKFIFTILHLLLVVVVVVLLLQFQLTYLKYCTELRHETLCTDRYP